MEVNIGHIILFINYYSCYEAVIVENVVTVNCLGFYLLVTLLNLMRFGKIVVFIQEEDIHIYRVKENKDQVTVHLQITIKRKVLL